MPIERYESYQAYLKQKEKNFAILDTVATLKIMNLIL